jgi:hypothetical protein
VTRDQERTAMPDHQGRPAETDPQVADDVEAADPAVVEELERSSWPARDDELEQRTGEGRSLHRQVPGGEESAEL